MKVITTTIMRKHMSDVINTVKCEDGVFAVGRRNKPEVLIIKYPEHFNKKVSNITNVNANSKSFDFLIDEPDLYNASDLKKKYA